MAAKKLQQSLADYVTIALSPMLIMALVGSLVFFLLEVLYAGQYPERLKWTLFFFVFGMVLVARISIELGGERAGFYGLGLAVAVFIALQAFIEYPPGSPLASFGWAINLGLMMLVWWCAHRLTWDCTHIDDSVDASGKGVLEAAGLDEPPAQKGDPAVEEDTGGDFERARPGLISWWDRYRKYREEQSRKPHTPGVWVVYFSLAALPLFGLGQSLIPAEDEERRRYVFWLMACYIGSGLGLLVTTSFLGLRRYLRQRKLKMPAAMTATWLAIGGGLIFVFLLVGALLPRPYGEYQILDIAPIGSKDRDASQYAALRDSAGKGEGQASSDPEKDDPDAQGGSGSKAGKSGQGQSSSQSSGGKSGQGNSGSGGKGGKSGGGKSQGKSGDNGSAKGERGDSKSDDKKDEEGDKRDEDKKDQEDQQAGQGKDDNKEKNNGRSSGQGSSQKRDSRGRSSGSSRTSSSSSILSFMSKLGWLGTLLKWLVFGILALVVIFFVLRSGLKFLSNFTLWARRLLEALSNWWANLFGSKRDDTAEEAGNEQTRTKRPRPFAYFHNPFQDGRAEKMSPDELTRYSFEALQAWAWERRQGRQPEETPLEFANRLGGEVPGLESQARGLAGLYARSAYAHGRLTATCIPDLREFWQRLETVEKSPLSA